MAALKCMGTPPPLQAALEGEHVVFLVDRSGSVNAADCAKILEDALQRLRHEEAPGQGLWVSILSFNDGLRWASSLPMTMDELRYQLPPTVGTSHLGGALELVAHKLTSAGAWRLPMTLVVISDGQATDSVQCGLAALLAHPRGADAPRIVLPVGKIPFSPALELLQKPFHPEQERSWSQKRLQGVIQASPRSRPCASWAPPPGPACRRSSGRPAHG